MLSGIESSTRPPFTAALFSVYPYCVSSPLSRVSLSQLFQARERRSLEGRRLAIKREERPGEPWRQSPAPSCTTTTSEESAWFYSPEGRIRGEMRPPVTSSAGPPVEYQTVSYLPGTLIVYFNIILRVWLGFSAFPPFFFRFLSSLSQCVTFI